MDTTDPKLFRRLHTLVARHFESSLTDGEHRELETLLLESPAARRLYVEYLQETACLRWLCLEEYSRPCETTLGNNSPNSVERLAAVWRWVPAALAALACSLLVAWWAGGLARDAGHEKLADSTAPTISDPSHIGHTHLPPVIKTGVATVTGLDSAHWTEAAEGGRLLARCQIGERWQLREGRAELTFDSGVLVTIFAPADFDITSPTSIRCRRGRVTALVDERGKGFTIETPQATVVDLGTQFGLDISDDGQTQVVVFQGSVDLTSRAEGGQTHRMEQGDALRLNNSGELQRLVAVRRDIYLASAVREVAGVPLIADVKDNIRKNQSTKSYQIVQGGLRDDALCFVDRDHQWNGIEETGLPEFLRGADYIMPFNDDKFVRDLELTVRVSRPAMLYVFLDNNMEVPDWLREEFEDTGVDIGLDGATTEWHPTHALGVGAGQSVDFPFSVWRRVVPAPGVMKLGGVTPPPKRSLGFNMYGVAAVDLQRGMREPAP